MLDRLGRPLKSLRISLTDRCNLRCQYCMPEESYVWLPRQHLLTFEEIEQVVAAFGQLGCRRVRLTGGEPLLRKDVPELVARLARQPLEDLAMTTNGVLLEDHAALLRQAGLHRLTVSLDTLDSERFKKLARRDGLEKVLKGIEAASRAGLPLKLDTVLIRGENDGEVEALLEYAASVGAELRFIEYMDVGGATRWATDKVVSRQELLERLGPVEELPGRGSAPAERFRRPDGTVFGIVASVTSPFCGACDRARLTADGKLFTCLYSAHGLDLREPLRQGKPLAPLLEARWRDRRDRAAEQRAGLPERGALADAERMREQPHLEMHTRGG
jgi:cyclic pyranopterin phosphate synthase